MMSARSVRVGIIGCGYWGPNFIRNFVKTPGCEVVAISDADPSRLSRVGQLYPGLARVSDGMELIRRADVDAVAIVTPVSSHYPLARAGLEAGKHVLVTKPLTRRPEDARELVRLARRENRVLLVDHTFLFSGPVRKIKELVESGEVGQIISYDSVRVNLGLFQQDVNVLWDLAPHDLSIMLHLMTQPPVSLSAIGAKPVAYGDGRNESVAYMSVRFPRGVMGHIHVSWLSPVKLRRTVIAGSRKMVVYDHLDPDNQVKIYDKGIDVTTPEEEYEARVQYRLGDMYAPKVDQTEALEMECQHFIDCCIGRAEPLVDGQAGYEIVRLLELAQASMERGGEVMPCAQESVEADRG